MLERNREDETKRPEYMCILQAFLDNVEGHPGWCSMMGVVLGHLRSSEESGKNLAGENSLNPIITLSFIEPKDGNSSTEQYKVEIFIVDDNDRRQAKLVVELNQNKGTVSKATVVFNQDEDGVWDIGKLGEDGLNISFEYSENTSYPPGVSIVNSGEEIFALPENYFDELVKMIDMGLVNLYNTIIFLQSR